MSVTASEGRGILSSALAIAAVTAVLKDLLNNGVITNDLASVAGNPIKVTAKPPDAVLSGQPEEPGLNLYLYHMTPNQGWRNAGLPSRNGNGDRTTNPPLAMDLHYLLMAYGREEYQAEILMGYAMQLLHETPVLTRQAIRTSLSALPAQQVSGAILPSAFQALAAADLANQIELVKISPEVLSIEELSKLWSAFQANHFRLTAGYQASVVLIESQKSTRATLPVLKPMLTVLPLSNPTINEIVSKAVPPAETRITAASTILINGSGLRGDVTSVRIGSTTSIPALAALTDSQISVDLTTVAGLRAGVQATQVIHDLLLGEPAPGTPHRGFESNVIPFVLHPAITVPATASFAVREINIGFAPRVEKAQRVKLFLYRHNASAGGARAYSFPAPADNGIPTGSPAVEVASIAFPFRSVEPGVYLAFVQVDGAESLLQLASGQFDAPRITITA
ncbi:MAG: DUF4255 domain-containing protein [Acidobacteriota bacterium]